MGLVMFSVLPTLPRNYHHQPSSVETHMILLLGARWFETFSTEPESRPIVLVLAFRLMVHSVHEVTKYLDRVLHSAARQLPNWVPFSATPQINNTMTAKFEDIPVHKAEGRKIRKAKASWAELCGVERTKNLNLACLDRALNRITRGEQRKRHSLLDVPQP